MLIAKKYELLVLSVGYLTLALALPRQKRQTDFEPQMKVEVLEQGPPCETKTKMGDDVKVKMTSYAGFGDNISRVTELTQMFKLDVTTSPEMHEVLVGMCPGEIRRLSYTINTDGVVYIDIELISIGDSDKKLPPEMDTNGDNVIDKAEYTQFLASIMGGDIPEEVIDQIFTNMDKNGDGVLDYNEMQGNKKK